MRIGLPLLIFYVLAGYIDSEGSYLDLRGRSSDYWIHLLVIDIVLLGFLLLIHLYAVQLLVVGAAGAITRVVRDFFDLFLKFMAFAFKHNIANSKLFDIFIFCVASHFTLCSAHVRIKLF